MPPVCAVSDTSKITHRGAFSLRMKLPALLPVLFLSIAAIAQEPKAPSPDDQYKLGPDSQPQEGVPEGKVQEFTLEDSKTFPGFTHKWWLYVPAQYDGKTPCA